MERDIQERTVRLAESEAKLDERIENLALDEAALNELIKEEKRPKEEFDELSRQNHQLCEKIESATAECQKAIDKMKDSLESERQKVDSEKKKRKAAEQRAKERRNELAKITDAYTTLTREYDLLEANHARQSNHFETAREENATLKRENRDLVAQKSAVELEAASMRRTNEQLITKSQQLNRRVADLQMAIAQKPEHAGTNLSCMPLDLNLVQAFSREVSLQFNPPSEVVSLGAGPFPEADFDLYLNSLSITPFAEGCPWIIVGRDDWSEERLNDLIDNADLAEVRVFSQELFMAGILTTHDPFSLPLEILMKFAEGHPALEYLIQAGFEWPEVVVEEDFGEPIYLRGSYERVEESPLYRMGYQVGATKGLTKSRRRAVLRSAYQGEIEDVEDADYMEEWGRPHRSRRLWRIAHHIAWLLRSRKSNPSMRYAVKDWKDDLDWLKEEFYTNRMLFKWPHG